MALFSMAKFVLLGNTPNLVPLEDLTLPRSMFRRYLELSPGTYRRYMGQRASPNCLSVGTSSECPPPTHASLSSQGTRSWQQRLYKNSDEAKSDIGIISIWEEVIQSGQYTNKIPK